MLRKLEKYEIEEEIGHGGMATVYRAHDTVLDRLVALKVMHPHLRAAEEARQRFHREAQSVARLRHPHVLEIYDFSGEGSEEAYIAAELLTGPTLKRWREDNQDVPAEIAACFTIEIAKALEHAHGAKIIHRDVKPENVLLHEDRIIKLTDFGIADMVDAASMTATGQILGSPGHMAPEQIEGKNTDTRTDLFSLGTVLYYLATGRLPFTGRNPHQILKRIVDSEYADPLRVNPTIGGRMRSIIVKALEKDADDRYQTAAELREDLEEFIAEAGIEDAEALLAKYLKDPDTVGKQLIEKALDLWIDRGARASDAGDVPTALDYYNRVLALDEGNEKVLKLIERVGQDRRRRTLMMAGGSLMLFGALATGIAYFLFTLPPDPVIEPTPVAESEEDAGTLVAEVAGEDAGQAAGEEDAATQLVEAQIDAGPQLFVRPIGRRGSTAPRAIRWNAGHVQNIMVSIDGAPSVPPHGLPRELRPGTYQVVLTPGASIANQYARTPQSVRVTSGSEALEVALQIHPQPANIRVICSVPDARVSVRARGGTIRGPVNETIGAPVRLDGETVTITVTAEGYDPFTQRQRLRLGQATVPITVDLQASASAQNP